MGPELEQVIVVGKLILNDTEVTWKKFILVPFGDPEIGPVTITNDTDTFIDALRGIRPSGGGDCPENSLSGILEALEVSNSSADIFVFTDASAKDYHLIDQVMEAIQNIECKIVFLLSGNCGFMTHPSYPVYTRIANASNGKVLEVAKNGVEQKLTELLPPVQCLETEVNGIKFEKVDFYFTQVEDRVFHMQQDRYINNFILYSDGSALKTLDMQSKGFYTIAGNSQDRTYLEGAGRVARFNRITSFEQLNKDTVVLTDHYNNCIRVVQRSTNSTATFAGRCLTEGTNDGSLVDVRFSRPYDIVSSSDPNVLYICDGKVIRKLNIKQNFVTTFINIDYTPLSLVVDSLKRNLFVSTSTRIIKINIDDTKLMRYLSPSTNSGFNDGPLELALFKNVAKLVFLNSQTILVADSGNGYLRVIDLNANIVKSICKPGGVSWISRFYSKKVFRPSALLMVADLSLVLVGGTGSISSLSIAGNVKSSTTSSTPTPMTATLPPPTTAAALAVITSLVLVGVLLAIISTWVCKTKGLCCFKQQTRNVTRTTAPLPNPFTRGTSGDIEVYEELVVPDYLDIADDTRSDDHNTINQNPSTESKVDELLERNANNKDCVACETARGFCEKKSSSTVELPMLPAPTASVTCDDIGTSEELSFATSTNTTEETNRDDTNPPTNDPLVQSFHELMKRTGNSDGYYSNDEDGVYVDNASLAYLSLELD